MLEALPAMMIAAVAGRPFAVRWRTTIHDFLSSPHGRWLVRCCLRRASLVVTNGKDIADQLVTACKIDFRKVVVCKNGVDTTVFSPGDVVAHRKRLEIRHHQFVILFPALLNTTSFAHVIIPAAEDVIACTPDVLFVFIAPEGELSTQLKSLKNRFNKNVRHIDEFVSPRELNSYMNAADIVIGKADAKYPGRIVLESLSTGTPVLIPDQPMQVTMSPRPDAKLDFRIPLEYVFVISATQTAVADFICHSQDRIRRLKRSDEHRQRARDFILGFYDSRILTRDELTTFAKTATRT